MGELYSGCVSETGRVDSLLPRMKTLRTIGFLKASRYLVGLLASLALKCCIVPQVRAVVLRLLGARIGKNSIIHDVRFINFYRGSFRNLSIGPDCFVGQECLIDLSAPLSLGDRATLGQRVMILTHMNVGYPDHPLQARFPSTASGVSVGKGCFIGASSTLLDGVTVGEGCFVAAGAVVSRSCPANRMIAGVPAREIRELASQAV